LNTAEEAAKAPGAVKQKNRTLALPPASPRHSHQSAQRAIKDVLAGGAFLLDGAQAEPNSEGPFNERSEVPAA